ncbi:MAG: porphobilinogen synthase, partial [Acidobacteria bacterium]|nr:porphobilinogen synthase [Acidobacteriota bacterium]
MERPRRLRRTPALRRLVRETRLEPRSLVHPAFVREGIPAPAPIPALAGHNHETVDSINGAAESALSAGCGAILLFGLPEHKDAEGSGAWRDDGPVQQSIRGLRRRFGNEAVVIADCCLCEYT